MAMFTVHLRRGGFDPDRDLVLVKEGFSVFAFLFGALWALYHRHWIVAVGLMGLQGLMTLPLHVGWLSGTMGQVPVVLGALLTGLLARDLRRWGLERRGFDEVEVVSAATHQEALVRVMSECPEIADRLLPSARV